MIPVARRLWHLAVAFRAGGRLRSMPDAALATETSVNNVE